MVDEAAALRAMGMQLRAARKARQLTQEELSELCQFDPTYISLLERGLRNPPFLTLCKLADQLGCPVRYLVETVPLPKRLRRNAVVDNDKAALTDVGPGGKRAWLWGPASFP